MNNEILQNQKIEDIIDEIQSYYSLDRGEANKIVIECISSVYMSDFPVILEEDGIYAVYKDKKNKEQLKYVKIKYSKKKSKLILQNIRKMANDIFLNLQKDRVVNFIKSKKNYLHAVFSHEYNSYDVYNLYFDKKYKYVAQRIKAIAPKQDKKKKRIYIDFTSVYYKNELVFFRELKNYKTIKHTREFTKDISREIYEITSKKIWIEVKSVDLNKSCVYIHIPYKTTRDIVNYIKERYFDVFELRAIL